MSGSGRHVPPLDVPTLKQLDSRTPRDPSSHASLTSDSRTSIDMKVNDSASHRELIVRTMSLAYATDAPAHRMCRFVTLYSLIHALAHACDESRLRREPHRPFGVSKSFIAIAKVSDALYTPVERVSNCRDAPTRTRLSSCICVANLMQLRPLRTAVRRLRSATQPFQGKTFPNQQPRRGLV